MITFIKTFIDSRYHWTDASGNKLLFNHPLFNQTRLKGVYQGSEVFHTIEELSREDGGVVGSEITLNLMEPIPFKAPCYSFQLSDAEFVRAITARAIQVIAPSSLVYVE